MQINEWLLHLLKRLELSRPDQRPLYQYRVTDQEFQEIRKTLKISNYPGLTNVSNQYWNAAFVIYAAEWWRREYAGGAWRWEDIFQSFGATAKDLTTQQRNQIIKTGLQYWHRKPKIIKQ